MQAKEDSPLGDSDSKPKAILIAVSDGYGGYGDFLFALKLSEQLKKHYAAKGLEIPPVYLVTQPTGKVKIQELKGDLEFGVEVLTPIELQEKVNIKGIDVGSIIEAPIFDSSLMSNINLALINLKRKIPLIMIPEYGYSDQSYRDRINAEKEYYDHYVSNLSYVDTVFSGFNKGANETGILLSDSLVNPKKPDVLVSQLDHNIRNTLLGTVDIYSYLKTTELSFQYSHDTLSSGQIPANQFLNIHCEFSKTSTKNQDVVMVGLCSDRKNNALKNIKNKLIANGFTRISFLNAVTQAEEVIHDSGVAGKTYRVIYTPSMSHPSMIACTALSGPLLGATGDQSLGEALSANKFMVYECLSHKKILINNYDEAMRAAFTTPVEHEILDLLRTAKTDEEYSRLGLLLCDPVNKERFQKRNKSILAQYDFISPIIERIDNAQQIIAKKTLCQSEIVCLLKKNKDQEALDLMRQNKQLIKPEYYYEGQSLIYYAREINPNSVFICAYIVSCLDSDQSKAVEVIKKTNCSYTAVYEGKTLLKHAFFKDPKGPFMKNYYLSEIARLLKANKEEEALKLLMDSDGLINISEIGAILDLVHHAQNKIPNGVFMYYYNCSKVINLLTLNKVADAFNVLLKNNISLDAQFEGKAIRDHIRTMESGLTTLSAAQDMLHVYDLVKENKQPEALSFMLKNKALMCIVNSKEAGILLKTIEDTARNADPNGVFVKHCISAKDKLENPVPKPVDTHEWKAHAQALLDQTPTEVTPPPKPD